MSCWDPGKPPAGIFFRAPPLKKKEKIRVAIIENTNMVARFEFPKTIPLGNLNSRHTHLCFFGRCFTPSGLVSWRLLATSQSAALGGGGVKADDTILRHAYLIRRSNCPDKSTIHFPQLFSIGLKNSSRVRLAPGFRLKPLKFLSGCCPT